jgi:hypothetical protein
MLRDMTISRLRLARLFPLIGAITLGATVQMGCASSTVLQTQPTGARVSINGIVVGQTPYTLTDTKIVGSTTPVRFELPGYAPLDIVLSRNEEVDVLPLIGGFICLVPFLWVMRYSSFHVYQMQLPGQGYPPAYAPPQNAWAPPPAQGYPEQPAPQGYVPAQNAQQPPAGPAGYPPPPPGYPPAAQ